VRSFKRQPNNRRSIYLNLVGSIESQLRQAFAKRHEEEGLTQAALAERLGVDRSAVNRRLTGRVNMTEETIADMVWGLGHCINVVIYDPDEKETNEFHISPDLIEDPDDLLRGDRPKSTTNIRTYDRLELSQV